MNLENLPSLAQTLKDHGIWAKKALGQNFLLDQNVTDAIARDAQINDATVIEVGPGPGGLTRSLLRAGAKRVIALEKDARFVKILHDLELASHNVLTVIEGDATHYTLDHIFAHCHVEGPVHIVANLPYNVGTHLLIDWLHHTQHISSMTLMFQKEVADRITAQPNILGVAKEQSKHYGRLSILSQYICDVRMVRVLPPSAFTPPPKVHSAVVRFKPKSRDAKSIELLPYLEHITGRAFQQRRKMLSSSLKNLLSPHDFENLSVGDHPIYPTQRPENLTLGAFIRLAEYAREQGVIC